MISRDYYSKTLKPRFYTLNLGDVHSKVDLSMQNIENAHAKKLSCSVD